jgi:hypothetical protein
MVILSRYENDVQTKLSKVELKSMSDLGRGLTLLYHKSL